MKKEKKEKRIIIPFNVTSGEYTKILENYENLEQFEETMKKVLEVL
jgi:hypothetical protein